jgi:hypothetical protein
MSKNEKEKEIIARPYEDADTYLARKRTEESERKKQQALLRSQSRNSRLEKSAPYPSSKAPSKSASRVLSKDEELALAGLRELQNKREISDVKSLLNITPSKPVPILSESAFSYTPSESDISTMREEFKRSQSNSLNFNDEDDMGFDMGFDLNKQLPSEEKGGRKRRRKSKKLRKSSKKSRKSKRKTTRKIRRRR